MCLSVNKFAIRYHLEDRFSLVELNFYVNHRSNMPKDYANSIHCFHKSIQNASFHPYIFKKALNLCIFVLFNPEPKCSEWKANKMKCMNSCFFYDFRLHIAIKTIEKKLHLLAFKYSAHIFHQQKFKLNANIRSQ